MIAIAIFLYLWRLLSWPTQETLTIVTIQSKYEAYLELSNITIYYNPGEILRAWQVE